MGRGGTELAFEQLMSRLPGSVLDRVQVVSRKPEDVLSEYVRSKYNLGGGL
jgi:hypothetical protein